MSDTIVLTCGHKVNLTDVEIDGEVKCPLCKLPESGEPVTKIDYMNKIIENVKEIHTNVKTRVFINEKNKMILSITEKSKFIRRFIHGDLPYLKNYNISDMTVEQLKEVLTKIIEHKDTGKEFHKTFGLDALQFILDDGYRITMYDEETKQFLAKVCTTKRQKIYAVIGNVLAVIGSIALLIALL